MLNYFINASLGTLFNYGIFRGINRLVKINDDKIYKTNIILSLIHCSFCSVVSLLHIFFDYDLIDYIANYSLGYLTLDLFLINYYDELKQGRLLFNIHHLIFIYGWILYDFDKSLTSRVLVSEFSTIFLNLRYLSKYYWPQHHLNLSWATMGSFFIVRIWNNYYVYFRHRNFIDNNFLVFYPYFGLQIYWFSLMMIKAIKTLLKKKED
jgi:hypothetical protein